MKRLLLIALFSVSCTCCFAQKDLLAYDDLKFLLQNNLQQADTFLVAKGYLIAKKNISAKNRKYTITFNDNTHTNVDIRMDGKKLFIELETNQVEQYNLIHNSIEQYIDKSGTVADVQVYNVKELGSIYITADDAAPYNPLRKDYDIHIVADKHITAYN